MSGNLSKRSSSRLSRQGFQPLHDANTSMDNTTNIPLQTVVSHTPSHTATLKEEKFSKSEKSGLFHGRRRVQKVDSKGNAYSSPGANDDEEKTALNKMGRFYMKILNFSIITRYMIYVAPLALVLAIPIILASTGVIRGKIGNSGGLRGKDANGADAKRFYIWIEISRSCASTAATKANFKPSLA